MTASLLESMQVDQVLDHVNVPSYHIDAAGVIRWLNRAAENLEGDHVVGVFGQVSDLVEEPHAHPDLHLTPRQAEVLELLERGRTTKEIAQELHLSVETVRNHVKKLLRAVGAHSRLEAVAIAHNAG